MKTAKQLERYFKGTANYHRINILVLVAHSKDVTVDGIAVALNGNFKTISEHTRKLVQAGLLNKRYQGTSVLHSLSPYGKKFLKFIKSF